MSASHEKDFDIGGLSQLGDRALDSAELPGSEWLHRQLDAMFDAQQRLQTALEQKNAQLHVVQAGANELREQSARAQKAAEEKQTELTAIQGEFARVRAELIAERDKLRRAGQQLIARMKEDQAKLARTALERDEAKQELERSRAERARQTEESRLWEARARDERAARVRLAAELERLQAAYVARVSGTPERSSGKKS